MRALARGPFKIFFRQQHRVKIHRARLDNGLKPGERSEPVSLIPHPNPLPKGEGVKTVTPALPDSRATVHWQAALTYLSLSIN